jgi:hypothetical protein
MDGTSTLRAEIEDLGRMIRDGGRRRAPQAFAELAQRLLSLTIMGQGGRVVLRETPRDDSFLLEGLHGSRKLVGLNNDRWLQIAMTLQIAADSQRLKVVGSVFQYLWEDDDQAEVFRYDYGRAQRDAHPCAHLNVHGELDLSEALPTGQRLKAVHFPTGRTSLEAVIRLLIEQFNIETNAEPETWRAALTASEAQFWEIAHLPTSGPGR